MTVVGWAAAFYYGVAVHRKGFGSYKQLLPLVLFQIVLVQSIAVAGIMLAIGGLPNIYAAPEYSFQAKSQWVHALAHLTLGMVASVLLGWGVTSVVLLVTKKASRRPVLA